MCAYASHIQAFQHIADSILYMMKIRRCRQCTKGFGSVHSLTVNAWFHARTFARTGTQQCPPPYGLLIKEFFIVSILIPTGFDSVTRGTHLINTTSFSRSIAIAPESKIQPRIPSGSASIYLQAGGIHLNQHETTSNYRRAQSHTILSHQAQGCLRKR